MYRRHELDDMEIRLETSNTAPDALAAAVAKEIRDALTIRVQVKPVPYGTLPRFDLKAKRFVDHRRENGK